MIKQAGEGKVCEESGEKSAVSSFGFTDEDRAAPSGCPERALGEEKSALEAHLQEVRYIVMASRRHQNGNCG